VNNNNNNKDDVVFQHDCLHVVASIERDMNPYQVISYCLSESPSEWTIKENNLDHKLTFAELYQQHITSQQLYLWSAPMDIVENYQLYLNELSTTNNSSSMASQLFYNCTLPRFGRFCQYSLDIYKPHHSSLNEIIYEFYKQQYEPTTLTCYIHLRCNRGSQSMCLDWSEICDGMVDCRDGIDEEYCWQLRFNVCEENEYQCFNGQCISKVFFRDDPKTFECLDRSDEILENTERSSYLFADIIGEPTFTNEDISCPGRHGSNQLKLTGSCFKPRSSLLQEILWSDKPNSVSDNCWMATRCILLNLQDWDSRCRDFCPNRTCKEIVNEICPNLMNLPASPLAFGHIFFVYDKEDIIIRNFWTSPPRYICYNDQLCDGFFPNNSVISFNNATCRRPADFPFTFDSNMNLRKTWYDIYFIPLYRHLHRCNKIRNDVAESCNNLTMYKCLNSSKCISKYRLCDNFIDCDYYDDEQCTPINGSCILYGLENLFQCKAMNICISLTLIDDGVCNCQYDEYGLCDDEYSDLRYVRKHISFPTICDGFTELIPTIIDGKNETDETECRYWQCNNTYTHCDGHWNCFDGADEVDCDLKCPFHHHLCVSPITNQFIYLPLEKADDGIIDCLGGTDEPKLCRSNNHKSAEENFYCLTYENKSCTSTSKFCYQSNCKDGSDKQFCDTSSNRTIYSSICFESYKTMRSNVESFFCNRKIDTNKATMIFFKLNKLTSSIKNIAAQDTSAVQSRSSSQQITSLQYQQFCHRGLPLRVWSNTDINSTTISCLCPPSFYGNMCQYQNQRVSLTMRLQVFSDSRRTLFTIIISLIDDSDERIIHSYQQITYLYTQHCHVKFNTYLLYSNRPKLANRNYSIHIDIYEKMSFTYRGSFLIPVNFPFLPVYRIAVQLNIPRTMDDTQTCSNEKCIHGRCIQYVDNPNKSSFCQCNQGWSGKYCTIPRTCTCSSDSLCIGISANNRSICICPLNKWGSLCLMRSTICQSEQNTTCQNGGQCIPFDENMISDQQFICICPKGFSGKHCEIVDNTIIISFHKDIILPQSILIHFFQTVSNGPPINGSTYKTVATDQKSITIFWPYPFQIAAAELFNDSYYLIVAQETSNQSSTISKTINPSDRCAHLSEVLNETIVNLHLLRRIKYYHLPCQNRSPLLSCFYDNSHFCLCNDFDHQRVANCFEFNASVKHDCFGQSNCENGAQCLQDRPNCPQTSICICPKCFYGTRCQFSSSLFGLSLDAILGYHIQPHISIRHQPRIVQVSVTLTILMFFIGLINGILSLIVFKNEETRKSGSGLYLFGSSISTLFITIIFTLKFWILISAQITYMTNRSFLYFQCMTLDYLLRIGLNLDQWFNTCVAMERAITVIKGINFNKQKSKRIAKYMIIFLVVLNVSTIIYDPIYRRLIDDGDNEDTKRIWCIVSYPSGLQTFNLIINIFHFCAPFLLNFISSFIIIIKIVQQRRKLQTNRTCQQLLFKQFRQHSHLFLSPLLLTILAVPRLIISLASDCMKLNNDSWLFLSGYFISFIPPTLTFVVFVIPSKLYKDQFIKRIKQYQRSLRNRIQPI
jgi:hypothetical protein